MFSPSTMSRSLRSATAVGRTANAKSAYSCQNVFGGYRRTYATSAERIHRVTMFKMPKAEDQQRFMAQARKMAAENQRNGKPYILAMAVGPTEDDPRRQGYTLVTKTEFANLDDMKFYEDDCPVHGAVKNVLKEVTLDGIMTVFFKAQVTGGSQQ